MKTSDELKGARMPDAHPRIPRDGDPKRYVHVEAPRCTHCGSANIRIYGKMPQDPEGDVRRYAQCLTCRGKFIVVEHAGPTQSIDIASGEFPIILVQPIRCPICNSTEVRSYCARDRGDGTNKHYMRCECDMRFIAIAPKSLKLTWRAKS